MKYKQYKVYKLLMVIILAGIVSSFVTAGNFVIPLAVLLVAVVLMFALKKNVDEALSDERIDKIAGKSSKLTFTISVFLMAVAGLILIALREKYPQYYIIGIVFSYFSCGILFLYSILFKYYSNKKI